MRIWDPSSGSFTPLTALTGPKTRALELDGQIMAGLPEGRLAVAGGSGAIAIINTAQPDVIEVVLDGHDAGIVALRLLPNSRLASLDTSNVLRLWRPPAGAGGKWVCIAEVAGPSDQGEPTSFAVLPNGTIATGHDGAGICVWGVVPAFQYDPPVLGAAPPDAPQGGGAGAAP